MKLLLLASAAVLIANDAHAQDTTSTTTTHIRGSVHTNENVSDEVILWPNMNMYVLSILCVTYFRQCTHHILTLTPILD